MSYIRYAVIIVCAWRVIHSLPFYLAAMTHSWVLSPWGAPDPTVLHVLSEVTGFQLVLWTAYMIGYSATAVALLLGKPWSVLIALISAVTAILTDFGYWIWVTSQTNYLAVEQPSFSIEDTLMNIASLLVLLGVSLIFFDERRSRVR